MLQHERTPSRRHEYPELLLDEWWIPTDAAVACIVDALRGKAVFNGIHAPVFHAPSIRRQLGERPSFTGWPEIVLDLRASRAGTTYSPPQNPAVAQGLRPYSSGTQAIVDWVWRAPTKDTSHQPHENSLVVVLPDYRARVGSAEWRGRKVVVDLDGSEDALELQCLVLADGTHKALAPIVGPSFSSAVVLDVPEGTERVELFLVRASGDLADQVTLFSSGEEFAAAPGEPTPEDRAVTELRNGEGQQVEFKPFVEVNDPKEEELVRTVVAFANTDGGRLYVGVRDQGTPEGTAALRRASRADPNTGLAALCERLQHLVREKVKPVPEFEVFQVRVQGEPVLVVSVPASAQGPFATHDNDVFIRKGATNRKPDPRTELPQIGGGRERLSFLPGALLR